MVQMDSMTQSSSKQYHRRPYQKKKTRTSSTQRLIFFLVLILLVFIFILVSIWNVFHFYTTITTTTTTTTTTTNTNYHHPLHDPTRIHQPQQLNATTTTKTKKNITIAFAVTVTGCGHDPITEGAAVLQHSIQTRASTKYHIDMIVFYTPEAKSCVLPLQSLGYQLYERSNILVNVTDIQGDYLRTHITQNGCCGEKELLKLEAYTLIQYPIVVHLDIDTLVWQSMDVLFDAMLTRQPSFPPELLQLSSTSITTTTRTITPINAFFTYDYNMVQPHVVYKPVQGGFLVLRPSLKVYHEFQTIVQQGDFRPGKGWGGKVGPFYGSMTFQGIIPYYYNVLHNGTQSMELNRCIFNQMADNPRTGKTIQNQVSGTCRTNTEHCEDCRERPMKDIVTTHYTICQKPWWCIPHSSDLLQHRLCRQLIHAWYQVRSEMELSWGRSQIGPGTYDINQFYGYCTKPGKEGYVPIALPYGAPSTYS